MDSFNRTGSISFRWFAVFCFRFFLDGFAFFFSFRTCLRSFCTLGGFAVVGVDVDICCIVATAVPVCYSRLLECAVRMPSSELLGYFSIFLKKKRSIFSLFLWFSFTLITLT
eukprot:GHVH01010258.1.p1 GENE.GHVH01010258.1~~GHVH01010258.1.p1  ORF type:complete len:112 (+),score=1.08 GHVH01010258.1:186-521(+)